MVWVKTKNVTVLGKKWSTCNQAIPFPALSLAVAGPVQPAVGAATRIGKPGEKMIYLERGNKCSEIWWICFRRQRQYAWQAYYVEVFQGSEIITFVRIWYNNREVPPDNREEVEEFGNPSWTSSWAISAQMVPLWAGEGSREKGGGQQQNPHDAAGQLSWLNSHQPNWSLHHIWNQNI